MARHDIIVIGASAGGVEALAQLVAGLPADLPAALFTVHHFPPHSRSVLPAILNRRGPLRAVHAADGDAIKPGCIYVAPPDYHLLLRPGSVRLGRGPRENGHRPAVDPLFRSAARAYGRRVVAVVLSGTLDDGTAGLGVVKRRGGVAIVQDPEEALYSGMPLSAIENVAVDHVVPLTEMATLLTHLAHQPVAEEGTGPVSDDLEVEDEIAELDAAAIQSIERPGMPSGFACPDCGGALWELTEEDLIRFRCRVGHAFSSDTLLAEQSDSLQAALWTALRALEESKALAHRLLERAQKRGHALIAARFERQVRDAEQRAALIRQALLRGEFLPTGPMDAAASASD